MELWRVSYTVVRCFVFLGDFCATGEGINALFDMIEAALALAMVMAFEDTWFGGSRTLSGGLWFSARVLGPDMPCTVCWSALSALKV